VELTVLVSGVRNFSSIDRCLCEVVVKVVIYIKLVDK